ncbi:unnamed protein product [Phytomonas sp. EM1]|nr:unnamed protein product [Phytomonas sp. EM1]|eukprot:CCW62102.1 unnamed protein product [Phytomonas sp. isolate EM1]
MKLEPREHRRAENYLVQFADQLKLGHLYLGYNKYGRKKVKARSNKAGRPPKTEKLLIAQKRSPSPARLSARRDVKVHKGKTAVVKAKKVKQITRNRVEPPLSTLPEAVTAGKTADATPTQPTDNNTNEEVLPVRNHRVPRAPRTKRAPTLVANTRKTKSASRAASSPPPLPANEAPLMQGKHLVKPTIRLISGEKYQCTTTDDTPLREFKTMLRRLKDPKLKETMGPGDDGHSTLLVMNGVVLDGGPEAILKEFNITDDSIIYLFP